MTDKLYQRNLERICQSLNGDRKMITHDLTKGYIRL
jgi:hypothetical protein